MYRRFASRLPRRVVSGGQTGVDRAALDAALAARVEHGGWCPQGRLAEDGPIDARYQLRETASADYAVRTEQNVIDSDATLILHTGRLAGGTLLTRRLARKHHKPCLLVDLSGEHSAEAIRRWIDQNGVASLNVAGPRESSTPGIGRIAGRLLREVLAGDAPPSSSDQNL